MKTRAEETDYRETGRYAEAIAFCEWLVETSPWVHLEVLGQSPEGRDLVALIVSRDGAFTPSAARASGKEIVLVNACIHPGESEGKDAGLALIRDLVMEGSHADLLEHAILLFVPIHSVDGHERFTPYGRINQHGPAEMGWRATAQNYNLNRDWLKADTPEIRAVVGLFHRWLPDIFVDLHNTNGADYQYDITYTLERHGNTPPGVLAWQRAAFDERIFPSLERQGHLLAPYIVLKTPDRIEDGFIDGAARPRFSTGYIALWNRPALLIETHMLKDYRTRVVAMYDIVKTVLAEIRDHPGLLRAQIEHADRETVTSGAAVHDPARKVPLDFQLGAGSVPFVFKGFATERELSAVSGAIWTRYDPTRPQTIAIPFFNQVEVTAEINPPLGYLVPVAWHVAIDRLRVHGIAFTELAQPLTCEVETYEFDHVEWEARPFENHHAIKELKFHPVRRELTFPVGSALVYLDQPGARVALHLLEPSSPDSLLKWGYFDAIFEPKEYAEERVMEQMAREMMARDPRLREEFEAKVAADAAFAASASARLDFFYRRTPYYDTQHNIYPIGRIFERIALP